MKSISFIATGFVGAIFAFAGGVFVVSQESPRMPDESLPWQEKVAYWKQKIDSRGGLAAYEVFAAAAEPLSYDDRHEWAHAFGSALFDVEGASGIVACDDRFSFGCYHQFLGDAIADSGMNSIAPLSAECFKANTKSPLSCQHGIGHGTLAAIGYDENALREALDICRGLPGTNEIGGCYGGVFMEYNMQTTLAENGELREYRGEPFDSCVGLDAAFMPACVYWQPQWWMQTALAGMPVEDAFRTMGEYCENFRGNPAYLRACYEGVGNVTAYESEFETGRAKELCAALSEERAPQLLCRSIAASHFRGLSGPPLAAQMCEGLNEEARPFCIAYAEDTISRNTEVFPYEL